MYNDTKVGRFEADSNSINVMLNPDILAGRTDRLRTKPPNPSETVRHEQAHQATPNCGNLCVQATLEEDNKHKDIRVRISNASVFANFDRSKDKTAVVKFCTPLVCKDGNRRTQQENETSSDVKTDEDSSLTIAEELPPITGESSASKGEHFVESPQTDDRMIREGNKVQRASLSSKINKTLRNLNCKSGGNKNQADRDRTNTEAELESLEATRTCLSIDDDTSGYHTSESPNIRVSDDYYVNEQIDESRRHECPASEAANDTLRILERLLEGTPELEGRRSRSVPRGRSDREINLVKSNLSGPIRVDYSGAALTAADLTRPEFVRWLTEIKEKTQNVERQLAEMNNTMRRTSLNDVPKNSISHNQNQEDCIELCHKFTSYNALPQKGKKTTRKKKQDECSQIDIPEINKIATSTPKTSKNIELKSEDVERIANKMDESSVESRKSNVVFTEGNQTFDTGKRSDKEPKDQQHVSKNRSKESSGTQTKVTTAPSRNLVLVDESTMFKPSKIHKLKNPPYSKQTITRDEIFTPQSIPSEPPKMESPPPGTSGRSFIPTRQTSPEKPRSASRRRSTSLEIDLIQVEPSSTSDDNEDHSGVQRDRRPSFFLQNYVNPVPRSAEGKSRGLNSNRRAQDSISFRTLHDTMDATGRSQNQSEFIDIERTRETPKPFTQKTMKKSTKPRKSIAQESPLLVTENCATNICNSSSRDCSIENATRKMVPQKNRTNTPEISRPESRSGRDSRSESASPRRRVASTLAKLFRRRTPEIEHVNDRSLVNDGRGSPRSPANRSRKRDSERELSMMSYGSNNSRIGHTETVARTATRKDTDVQCSVHSNDLRTKAQQRSKSDTRESRSNAGRGYR